jgi:hypothetical protein
VGAKNKPRSGRQPSFIILTEEFYNEIIEHAVPLYKGALRELEAAFALDIYMWSTFRAAYFEKYDKKECVRIPRAALKNQFGADYKQLKTFRYWFRHYLAEVRTIYPGLRIDDTDSDFLIFEPLQTSYSEPETVSGKEHFQIKISQF